MQQTEIKYEVVYVNTKKPKLTLAADRTTIKLPIGTDNLKRDTLERFAQKIRNEMDVIIYTWRGSFKTNSYIKMSNNSCTIHKVFKNESAETT